MKIVLFLLTFISTFFGFSQTSYDFGIPVPVSEPTVMTIRASHFGTYASKSSTLKYEFSADGIYTLSTIISSISRETIRENSQYDVRNGYIFGVEKNDSLPCILENDRYYFGVRRRTKIAGANSANVLKEIAPSTYILNREEDGRFIPTLFTFTANGLSVQHFDYEFETTLFDTIGKKLQTKESITTVTLFPTEEEWKNLDITQCFGENISYVKQ